MTRRIFLVKLRGAPVPQDLLDLQPKLPAQELACVFTSENRCKQQIVVSEDDPVHVRAFKNELDATCLELETHFYKRVKINNPTSEEDNITHFLPSVV